MEEPGLDQGAHADREALKVLAGREQLLGQEPATVLRAKEARAFAMMAAPEEGAGTAGAAATEPLGEEALVTLWVRFGRMSRE